MKLTVGERLTLLGILPEESNYAGVREIFRLRQLLGLTDDESKEIEVQPTGDGRIQWNQEKALGLIVDIAMGEWITEMIRGELRKLDKEYRLSPEIMSLYEKFILDYE
ncbi:MAG: hypothetical protein ACXAB9_12630 [Candidatus Thorarchaeota archaeon]|jgi:hypothetical protein